MGGVLEMGGLEGPPMPPTLRTPAQPGCSASAGERAPHAPEGVVVAGVRRRTTAAAAGFLAGDRIVAINGHALRDAIDFQFHAGDERLEVALERAGERRTLRLRRDGGDLGLELAPPRPGEIATCANKCVFC